MSATIKPHNCGLSAVVLSGSHMSEGIAVLILHDIGAVGEIHTPGGRVGGEFRTARLRGANARKLLGSLRLRNYSIGVHGTMTVSPVFLRVPEEKVRANLKLAIGVAVCSLAALVLALFLNESRETRLAAPPMCLLVVIVTTIYFGRLAGILGAAAASCVLAVFLYSPFGSLYVEEHAARTMLNLFLVGAAVVAFLVPRRLDQDGAEKPHPKRAATPPTIAGLFKRDNVE